MPVSLECRRCRRCILLVCRLVRVWQRSRILAVWLLLARVIIRLIVLVVAFGIGRMPAAVSRIQRLFNWRTHSRSRAREITAWLRLRIAC